jgi:nitrogen regulatory protein P-II 1
MHIDLVIAIIRSGKLEAVEKALQDIGVKRLAVTKVKGFGEYHNFFARTWLVEEVRIEIFAKRDEVEKVTTAIMNTAHTGEPGDGVVAVIPIEKLFLIRTRSEATPDQFWPLCSS